MIRWLKYRSLLLRRSHPPTGGSWLARFLHSDLVHWNRSSVTRGTATGMFWAFIPIPFQMIPAILFCWLLRGNLAVAIIIVWISNPLTLAPIIYLEYRLGELILAGAEVPAAAEGTLALFAGGLKYVMVGALFVSIAMMLAGYVAVQIAFTLSERRRARRRAKQQA
ncbi:MAG: DUF2062 domain-containing protein [Betaproteobacteria bacterium AqS2]|uniref:DUF2062 domain-containing protein n=1 Tax=Candidatus Amphirhobacter heronislandensis TaxID=1732024 RepID=A0A930Y368_9GAMM|nr:DUF2062 domain-containing protein [Betaproteobacteria bacterium AqS2]